MVILNLYGVPFHAVVVFRPEHDFLFKSASTYCGFGTIHVLRNHKKGEGGQKMSIFDYVQYLKYVITKGREGGSENPKT